MIVTPQYTPENCQLAYQLDWSLSVFWKKASPPAADWLDPLSRVTEPDGVRILEHHTDSNSVSQFLLSTKPHVAPSDAIRSVKGRLQYLLREDTPQCFCRNYSMTSVGSSNVEAIENYVARQVEHHRPADPRVQELLGKYQFYDPQIDLTERRRSASGEFIHNLHLVLVREDRLVDVREESLRELHDSVRQIADKKQHLLSRIGLALDHLHFTVGCNVTESPQSVGLSYLNELADQTGTTARFQFGFFVGTFGPYDLQAIRRCLAPSWPVTLPAGQAGPVSDEERARGDGDL
jgi:REP element-mobilizing transposase RayT